MKMKHRSYVLETFLHISLKGLCDNLRLNIVVLGLDREAIDR